MKNRKQINRITRLCPSVDGYSMDVLFVEEFIKETKLRYPDKPLTISFETGDDEEIEGLVIYVYETLSEEERKQIEIEQLKKQFKKAVDDQYWTSNLLNMNKSQIPQYERRIEYLNKEIDDTIQKLKEFGIDYKKISTE